MLLRVEAVSHRYDDVEILRDLDLIVEPGMCVALVGPNGAGKSTLLRLVSGRERPSQGRVLYDERDMHEDDRSVRRTVATVLGDPVFYPDLTAREHLELVLAAHGVGADAKDHADAALASWGLGTRGDVRPATFSAGQKQALFLAAAFVRPLRLLIVDEPEQHLDSEACDRLVTRFRAVTDAGGAVIFSTHQPELAHAAASHVLTLRHGRRHEGHGHDALDDER